MNFQNKGNKKNFTIVEDNENFRNTLTGLLKIRPDVDRIIEFSSAEEALHSESLLISGFLIVDYRLGKGMDGISFLGEESVKSLQIPKLILTGYNAESKIFDALKHGATGYMFKEDIYSLGQILEIILSGGAYISPTIAVIVANFFKSESNLLEHQKTLTEREEEILREIASGYSPAEIAERLSLSLTTIRTHIRNIYKKLEVNNQIQLLKKANESQY